MPDPFPEMTSPLHRLRSSAADAWRGYDFEAYFRLMREAERLTPADPQLLPDLGAAHASRINFPEAERYFQATIAAASDRAGVLVAVALRARNALRFDWAEKYLSMAAVEPGATGDTLAKLAEMAERLRQSDAATAAVDRALALDPHSDLAMLVRGRLHRSAGRL